MFKDSIVESKMSTAKKTSTVVVSTAAHALVIGILIVAPMLVTAALPSGAVSGTILFAPGSGMSAAAAAAAPLKGGSSSSRPASPTHDAAPSQTAVEFVETATVAVAETPTVLTATLVLPTAVPQAMARWGGGGEAGGTADGLLDGKIGGVLGGLGGGLVGGMIGGVLNGNGNGIGIGNGRGGPGGNGPGGDVFGIPGAPPAVRVADRAVAVVLPPVRAVPPVVVPAPAAAISMPPPPPPPPPAPTPIGGDVLKAACLKCDPPAYPNLAQISRISDTVVLSAIVGTDGLVKEVRVIRGHTLLKDAAVDAVKKWSYKPQKLNGKLVEVTATISIAFVFEK